MKKQIITITAALLVGLSSCTKDEKTKETGNPKTKAELLVQGAWEMEKSHVTTTAGGQVIFDVDYPMSGTVEFKADHSGITKITGESPESFNWDLKGDSLYVDGEALFIQKLNATRLEVIAEENEMDTTMGNLNILIVTSFNR